MREEDSEEKQRCGCRYWWLEAGVYERDDECRYDSNIIVFRRSIKGFYASSKAVDNGKYYGNSCA